MIKPPISELMKKVDSRYTLCVVVAKRARQILDGAHSLVKCNSEKPVTIAAYEVNEGKLMYVRTKSGLK
jgi:DNA-directed RNA polymerase, omega subunit